MYLIKREYIFTLRILKKEKRIKPSANETLVGYFK